MSTSEEKIRIYFIISGYLNIDKETPDAAYEFAEHMTPIELIEASEEVSIDLDY